MKHVLEISERGGQAGGVLVKLLSFLTINDVRTVGSAPQLRRPTK